MIHKSVLMFNGNVSYWLKIQSRKLNITSTTTATYDDDYDYEYDGDEEGRSGLHVVWETEVQPFTDLQRWILSVVVIIVAFIAILGNLLVLYVNFSR